MDPTLIDRYEKGGTDLRMAIRGLQREDLLAFPVPGTWSIQQIVVHLMDSDLILAERMKRVIAEENPTLIGFDESLFVRNLFYEEQSAEEAAELFDLNRRGFARVLKKLGPAAFDRVGTHSERGPMTLALLLGITVKHLQHHLEFIVDKREKLGKLMW